jgi:hypothetical protein
LYPVYHCMVLLLKHKVCPLNASCNRYSHDWIT